MRADLVDRYRGRWVALDVDGTVLADADELALLLGRLESTGIRADTVQRVPAADDPLFIGLG